ncbi:MAG: DUF4837 family protein [bacterium]
MNKKIIVIGSFFIIILTLTFSLSDINGSRPVPPFLVSCTMTPNSWWDEGVIGIMADSSDWQRIQVDLKDVFERTIRTPQLESTFRVKHVPMEQFELYTRFKYLIIASTMNSGGKIGQIVKEQLQDSLIKKGVLEGEYYVFPLQNQWAKKQLIAVLVAKDIHSLREKIHINREFIYNIFKSDYEDYIHYTIEGKRANHKLKEELLDKYDWTLLLQRDYFMVQEFPDQGFIWFRRLMPERWIFVRWIEGGDMSMLRPEWVIRERNRIGAKYYGGDSVVNKYLYSREGEFLGREAQITRGLWENEPKVKGGPFKNYTFYDPLTRRVFMIDLAMYAPQKDKLPYLHRMDVIAKTFRTIFDREEE